MILVSSAEPQEGCKTSEKMNMWWVATTSALAGMQSFLCPSETWKHVSLCPREHWRNGEDSWSLANRMEDGSVDISVDHIPHSLPSPSPTAYLGTS